MSDRVLKLLSRFADSRPAQKRMRRMYLSLDHRRRGRLRRALERALVDAQEDAKVEQLLNAIAAEQAAE